MGCARRPRPEVYPYWPARLMSVLSVLAPGLVDRVMSRLIRRAQDARRAAGEARGAGSFTETRKTSAVAAMKAAMTLKAGG